MTSDEQASSIAEIVGDYLAGQEAQADAARAQLAAQEAQHRAALAQLEVKRLEAIIASTWTGAAARWVWQLIALIVGGMILAGFIVAGAAAVYFSLMLGQAR